MIPEMLISLGMWWRLILARSHLYFLREVGKVLGAGMKFTGVTIRLPNRRAVVLGVIRHSK